MMTWEYRVFREDDGTYVIREVFYDDDGSIIGCTANAVEPFGDTLEGLAESVADFQAALALPVLTVADMPKPSIPRTTREKRPTVSSADVRAQLGLGEPSPINKP